MSTITQEPWHVHYEPLGDIYYQPSGITRLKSGSNLVAIFTECGDAEYVLECIDKYKDLDNEVDALENDKEELEEEVKELKLEIQKLKDKIQELS